VVREIQQRALAKIDACTHPASAHYCQPTTFSPTAAKLLSMAEEILETEGKIVAVLAGTMFKVELDNKHQVLAHISGRMRKRFIRLTTGDRVKLEMSPYDLSKARIVYRLG